MRGLSYFLKMDWKLHVFIASLFLQGTVRRKIVKVAEILELIRITLWLIVLAKPISRRKGLDRSLPVVNLLYVVMLLQ